MEKEARLLEIARRRKDARWPPHKCIGDYHDGAYECAYVSPYTKAAHNLDAAIMVLLQDWSCDDQLSAALDPEAQQLGYTPKARTNVQLKALLKKYFDCQLCDIFATNVFP